MRRTSYRALVEGGFLVARREAVVELDLDRAMDVLASARMPDGIEVRRVDGVDVDELRRLDDELRDDVPGTAGWRSSPEEFAGDTFDDPAFNPGTYPVAVDAASGALIGLVRVWMNPDAPRIGMMGVRRSHRRRGIVSALLREALGAARALGATRAVSEYDVTNVASATFARMGAARVGELVELVAGRQASGSRSPTASRSQNTRE